MVLAGLTGCADIWGRTQDISVTTNPRSNAQCLFKNDLGSWSTWETPAKITVQYSPAPLEVSCHTAEGLQGQASIQPEPTAAAATDPNNGDAYQYPDRLVIALSEPVPALTSPFGVEKVSAPGQSLDPMADAERKADDNLVTRFQTLRQLLDDGLITREEYNNRRGANLGALLRYSMVPGARDLTRAAPPPRTLVQRMRYLAAAYAEHSISASEQASERAVILDGLLPYPVTRCADPPPRITDQMQLAAEIGRTERLRVANVITDAEAAREKAKAAQLLDAAIAAADAAARAAAGMAATQASMSVNSGIGIALSTHNSEAQARRAWAGLQKAHPAELGQLGLSLKKIPRPHRPTHYQIIAGPLPDKDTAIGLCKSLRKSDLFCDAAVFGE